MTCDSILATMIEREFFIGTDLPGVVIRIRYQKDRGRILWFVVQLEIILDEQWLSITRYDTAHGFIHRDDMRPNGEQFKSGPLIFPSYEDGMNFAINDLRTNAAWYVERFNQWKI
jgi:hypothetical protein